MYQYTFLVYSHYYDTSLYKWLNANLYILLYPGLRLTLQYISEGLVTTEHGVWQMWWWQWWWQQWQWQWWWCRGALRHIQAREKKPLAHSQLPRSRVQAIDYLIDDETLLLTPFSPVLRTKILRNCIMFIAAMLPGTIK